MSSRPAEPGARTPSSRREAGYNMVVLMVGVTLLAVATAAALPMWSQAMKREKEAELISRGWQYAEAIRVFQQRHGRYPTRLEELIEVKPRSIRRLWKDPMTESGEWGLVFQGGVTPPGGNDGRELAPSGGLGAGDRGRDRGGLRTPRPGEQRTVGPIVGVRSLSDEESIKVLFDEQSYEKWQFTAEKFTRGLMAGGRMIRGLDRTEGTLVRAEWIGRPFPPGLMPQTGSPPEGAQQPVGPDGRPRPQTPPGVRPESRR
ncbi:MAG TPA: hypothetical protein VLF66_05415 [Thermoanaerobaculia bacterium]|nr:hypothetical protein [Thermoanaerobaculia bacterium]